MDTIDNDFYCAECLIMPDNESASTKTNKKKKIKKCKVISYNKYSGVVGFYFDDLVCQMDGPKNANIRGFVNIEYSGSVKNGLKLIRVVE